MKKVSGIISNGVHGSGKPLSTAQTLVNSLKDQGHEQKLVEAAVKSLKLSPTVRTEILSIEQFIELTRRIYRPGFSTLHQ